MLALECVTTFCGEPLEAFRVESIRLDMEDVPGGGRLETGPQPWKAHRDLAGLRRLGRGPCLDVPTAEFDAAGRTWLVTPELHLIPKDKVRTSPASPLRGIDLREPGAPELPTIETLIVEVPSPHGPFGGKGIGEAPVVGGPAAVASAIAAATGLRMRELPMTPERVWAALGGSPE